MAKPRDRPFPLDWAAFKDDTAKLTPGERVAYLDVLVFLWDHGGVLQDTPETWATIWPTLGRTQRWRFRQHIIEMYLQTIEQAMRDKRHVARLEQMRSNYETTASSTCYTQRRVLYHLWTEQQMLELKRKVGAKGGGKASANRRKSVPKSEQTNEPRGSSYTLLQSRSTIVATNEDGGSCDVLPRLPKGPTVDETQDAIASGLGGATQSLADGLEPIAGAVGRVTGISGNGVQRAAVAQPQSEQQMLVQAVLEALPAGSERDAVVSALWAGDGDAMAAARRLKRTMEEAKTLQ